MVMMPCSAKLTKLLVADLLVVVPEGTGSFPMELEFPVQVTTGISTEPEVRWWYVCTAEEVEWKESTAVRYLILLALSRPYTLECTQQALVSGRVNQVVNRIWIPVETYINTCKEQLCLWFPREPKPCRPEGFIRYSICTKTNQSV